MSSPLKHQQQGFTILELMIATLVFSVIFLGATTALLQISKLYYKGVVGGRTQEISRGIIDQISQQLQFSSDTLTAPAKQTFNVTGAPAGQLDFNVHCIGNTRYTYIINAQVNNSIAAGNYDRNTNRLRHALWRDTVPTGTCVPADLSRVDPSTTPLPANGSNGEEMLNQHMRLADFQASCNTDNICTVGLSVIYGDNDLLTPDPLTGTPTQCQSIIGNQWCATVQFNSTVLRRVDS